MYVNIHINIHVDIYIYHFKVCGIGLSLRMKQVNSRFGRLFRGKRKNRS